MADTIHADFERLRRSMNTMFDIQDSSFQSMLAAIRESRDELRQAFHAIKEGLRQDFREFREGINQESEIEVDSPKQQLDLQVPASQIVDVSQRQTMPAMIVNKQLPVSDVVVTEVEKVKIESVESDVDKISVAMEVLGTEKSEVIHEITPSGEEEGSKKKSKPEQVTNVAHQVFDPMPLRKKLWQNLRKKKCSKTWWFKFKEFEIPSRMLELGMTPVLPSFSGNVPSALRKIYSGVNITRLDNWNTVDGDSCWCCTYRLNPSDPLFIDIEEAFIKQQIEEYGELTNMYNCDTFNENTPPTSEPEYISSPSTGHILAPIYKRFFQKDQSLRESDNRAYWLEFWGANEELVNLYEKRLGDVGYLSYKLGRTNNCGNGLLTAVHQDYFGVVNSRDLLFNDCGARVAQLLQVELVPPYSQLQQVYEIFQYVESYQKEVNLRPMPIILCGDWNGNSSVTITFEELKGSMRRVGSEVWFFVHYSSFSLLALLVAVGDIQLESDINAKVDRDSENNQHTLRFCMEAAQIFLPEYMDLLLQTVDHVNQISARVGMVEKLSRISPQTNRVWDPGGFFNMDKAT